MPGASNSDFVEALARGLAIITAFSPTATTLSVTDAADRTSLPRPTARRLLMTLEQLGYVRSNDGLYTLTTKVLELGTGYIAALGIWELARPHLEALVAQTGESSSMSQLDGSDIVYVARVPVPKIIALSVHIGTRFPAAATSMGHVLLADLPRAELSPGRRHAGDDPGLRRGLEHLGQLGPGQVREQHVAHRRRDGREPGADVDRQGDDLRDRHAGHVHDVAAVEL